MVEQTDSKQEVIQEQAESDQDVNDEGRDLESYSENQPSDPAELANSFPYDWDWLNPKSDQADNFIIDYLHQHLVQENLGVVDSTERALQDYRLLDTSQAAINILGEEGEFLKPGNQTEEEIVESLHPDTMKPCIYDHRSAWLCTKRNQDYAVTMLLSYPSSGDNTYYDFNNNEEYSKLAVPVCIVEFADGKTLDLMKMFPKGVEMDYVCAPNHKNGDPVKGRVGSFTSSKDEGSSIIRISNLSNNKDLLTIFHELGHAYMYEQLGEDERRDYHEANIAMKSMLRYTVDGDELMLDTALSMITEIDDFEEAMYLSQRSEHFASAWAVRAVHALSVLDADQQNLAKQHYEQNFESYDQLFALMGTYSEKAARLDFEQRQAINHHYEWFGEKLEDIELLTQYLSFEAGVCETRLTIDGNILDIQISRFGQSFKLRIVDPVSQEATIILTSYHSFFAINTDGSEVNLELIPLDNAVNTARLLLTPTCQESKLKVDAIFTELIARGEKEAIAKINNIHRMFADSGIPTKQFDLLVEIQQRLKKESLLEAVVRSVANPDLESAKWETAINPNKRLNRLCYKIMMHFHELGMVTREELLTKFNDQTGEPFADDWEQLLYIIDLINSRNKTS